MSKLLVLFLMMSCASKEDPIYGYPEFTKDEMELMLDSAEMGDDQETIMTKFNKRNSIRTKQPAIRQ